MFSSNNNASSLVPNPSLHFSGVRKAFVVLANNMKSYRALRKEGRGMGDALGERIVHARIVQSKVLEKYDGQT